MFHFTPPMLNAAPATTATTTVGDTASAARPTAMITTDSSRPAPASLRPRPNPCSSVTAKTEPALLIGGRRRRRLSEPGG